MGIGTTLKELLKERGMTAKKLAEETGISINTIYGILKRDNDSIKPEFLFKIADALNVSPDSILEHAKKSYKDEQEISHKAFLLDELLEKTNFRLNKSSAFVPESKSKDPNVYCLEDSKRGLVLTISKDEMLDIFEKIKATAVSMMDSIMIEAIHRRISGKTKQDPAPTDTTEQSTTATDTD